MKAVYGGSGTPERRRNTLRYAHREARRRNRLFYWTVIGTRKRRDGTRTEFPNVVGFASAADRDRGIVYFGSLGANHFTCFRDVNATFALQIGRDARRKSVTVNR